MCRLFAFKSCQKAGVAHWLVDAENALMKQSIEHPDGWGVAYFQHGHPHVVKGLGAARENQMFQQVGKALLVDTVLAHIRRRTQGDISLLNCHPFQYGCWVMAHNGDLPGFSVIKEPLRVSIDSQFLTHVFGSTDSELYGALIMQKLYEQKVLTESLPPIEKIIEAVRCAIRSIEELKNTYGIEEEASLNVILTNGDTLVAYRHGRELNYWVDIDERQRVKTLCVSSERTCKDKRWNVINERHYIALDHEGIFHSGEL